MDSLDTLIAANGLTPSTATSGEMKPRVLIAQFGGGYEQRTKDGPNSLLATWSVQWNTIDQTKLGLLKAFFDTQAGANKFTWTQPPPFNTAGALAWISDDYGWTYDSGRLTGFTATLQQRPLV